MWRTGKDVNEESQETILLLEPKAKATINSAGDVSGGDPRASFVGGHPSYYYNSNGNGNDDNSTLTTPKCQLCQRQMYLLLQMHAPLDELDRTMYIFACNKASCIQKAFSSSSSLQGGIKGDVNGNDNSNCSSSSISNNRFNLGGAGVVRCIRSQSQCNQSIGGDDDDNDSKVASTNAMDSDKLRQVGKETKDQSIGAGHADSSAITTTAATGWGDDNDSGGDGGGGWGDFSGWGDENDDAHDYSSDQQDPSMDDLEAMLCAIEMKEHDNDRDDLKDIDELELEKQNNGSKRKKKKNKNNNTTTRKVNNDNNRSDVMKNGTNDNEISAPSFQRYELDVYNEPPSKSSYYNKNDNDSFDQDDDEELIGTGTYSHNDDSAVQKMLSSYLKEEDDETLKAAIKGGPTCDVHSSGNGISSNNKNTVIGEKYERLPPDDRAFLAFTDRVKRAPFQAVRYAYGGVPMWSIPTPLTPIGKKGRRSRDTKFPNNDIPQCVCGSKRTFEFQLMPSILHLLDVDSYCEESTSDSTSLNIEDVLSKNKGGMNWGVIAVYSCSNSCFESTEEFVIVQESADANPVKKKMEVIS